MSTVLGGNELIARSDIDSATGIIFFDLNKPILADGQISSWAIYAGQSGGQIELLIYRDLGTTWEFVGNSPVQLVTAVGINTYSLSAPISVKAGDLVAFWYPPNTIPSVSSNFSLGQTVNNHDWPWEPIDGGRLAAVYTSTIPDLQGGITFDDTTWDTNTRTYSIQVFGTGSAEVQVVHIDTDIADNDDSPSFVEGTNFDTTTVNGTPVVRTFMVENRGTETLTLSAPQLPDGFSIVPADELVLSLAPGASDTFKVQLDTTIAGTKTGDITFTTSDPDESTYNFRITGLVESGQPEAYVYANGFDVVDNSVTADPLNGTAFGTAAFGSEGVTRTFSVFNTGSGALTTSLISVPDGFEVVEGLDLSIAPGATDTFQIRLKTTEGGTKTGQISFATNDSDENPYNFTISGTVTSPPGTEITVRGNGVSIADDALVPGTANGTDFGTVGVGSIVERSFTVTSAGIDPLTISKFKPPKGFIVVDPLAPSIAAGESDTLTLRMDTAKVGTKGGQVTFTTNDADETAFNFALSGNVVVLPSEITVLGKGVSIADNALTPNTADDTDFGSATVGSSVIHTFTVTNSGTGALTVTKMKMPKGFVLADGLSTPIAVGGSDTFQVRMDTTKVGVKSGQITFTTNDADEGAFNFALTGTVTAASSPVTSRMSPELFESDRHGEFVFDEITDRMLWDPDGAGRKDAYAFPYIALGAHDFDLM